MTTATTAATAFVVIVMLVSMAVATAALMIVTVVVTVTAAAALVLMMMTTLTVNMAVGDLFGRRGTHITHRDVEVQVDAGQRVVGIDLDEIFRHFDHSHRTVAIIGIGDEGIAFSHFHAVEQLARYLLHQIFVVFAIGIGGIDVQLEAVAGSAVIQGLFQTRNQKTGAVQVDQRLAAFGAIQHIARLIRNGIVEGNYAQVAYFHVGFPLLAPPHERLEKLRISIPEKKTAAYRSQGADTALLA